MKKTDIPQDPSVLDKFTKEVCYAVDDSGKYTTELSRGWEVKASALGVAWEDIEQRATAARISVEKGEASPIAYFMELRLMDLPTLAAYTGFWKWTVKRHLKPNVFAKLSEKQLSKYATVFEVSSDQIKSMRIDEN